jgi:hypothetical protein
VGTTDRGWRTSSYSDGDQCVEIKFAVDQVLVRNSRRPEVVPIAFGARSWREFLSALSADGLVPAPPRD